MKLIMKVDYFDQASSATLRGEGLYDEARIAALMSRCAQTGFTHIFWRTSVCGRVSYPSRVMAPFEADYRLSAGALAECMARFDPLEIAVKMAHDHGMKLAPWITTMDSYFPGVADPFFARRPHLLLMNRESTCVERGVPCYAYPEVAEYRLAEVKEVMAYGADGIFYSAHSHNDCTHCQGDLEGDSAYGYNPPIAEEYQRRHGIDPRTGEFDLGKLRLLRGEFFLDFIRRAYGVVKSAKGDLWLYVEMPEATNASRNLGCGLYSGPRAEYFIPLEELFGVADHIIFLVYPETEHDVTAFIHALKTILRSCPGGKGYWVEAHVGFSRDEARKCLALWRILAERLAGETGIQGISFHEAMTFEFHYPESWAFAEHCATL